MDQECLSYLLKVLPWDVIQILLFFCVKHNNNKTLNRMKGNSFWASLRVEIPSGYQAQGYRDGVASGLTGCIIL